MQNIITASSLQSALAEKSSADLP